MQHSFKIAILIADHHDGRGGLENVLIDITTGIQALNINSYIAMLEAPTHKDFLHRHSHIETFSDTQYLALQKRKPTFMFRLLWKYKNRKVLQSFFKKLHQFHPDALIITNFSSKFIHHYPLFKEYKRQNPHVAFIFWPHGSLMNLGDKNRLRIRKKIDIFDDFYAISAGIKKELQSLFNIQHIKTLYNPITKAKLIPRDISKLIYIGRLNAPEKRVRSLLKILSTLQGSWQLDLYGSLTPLDEETDSIQEYIAKLNLSHKVFCHGWVNDPWSEISSAGVLLLNSSSEGFGLVLAEAMMRGIPCISSDCPVGPNEIIKNGHNGWLYPVNEEIRCREILQKILDGELILPAQSTIQKSVEKFNSDTVIHNFAAALRASIAQSNPDQ